MRKTLLTVAALAAALGLATATRGNISFPTFPNATGLTLVTNASVTGGLLRITPSTTNNVGAAWYTAQQSVGPGFSTTFTFKITNQVSGGADGFAFVIQNSAVNAIGVGGCQLGYDPIPNCVAVEVDTYQSGTCSAGTVNDPNDNHISIHTRGTLANSAQEGSSIGMASTLPNMSDGAVHTMRIDYSPGEMDVYLDDMTTPKITAPLPLDTTLSLNAGKAWVGFTGATGGAAERHDITSWTFTEGAPAGTGRPRTPIITEPQYDGRVVNPQDVHMETGAFFDGDGDTHLCTDWQLWKTTGTTPELIWHSDCITGVEKLHIHLGDGQFTGSYTGRVDLEPSTNFQLKARHRDNSGNSANEWSLWGLRNFVTGAIGSNLPMLVEDLVTDPRWTLSDGSTVVLPAGLNAPTLYVETGDGRLLAAISGNDGLSNLVTNPGSLGQHGEVRARFNGGTTGLSLAASVLRILDEDCVVHNIYLPAVALAPGAETAVWVSTTGSTYVAAPGADHADLSTLARGSEMPYLVVQPGYVVEKFATGFQLPVNIAFVPNPGPNSSDIFFYVTELYGNIKVVTRDGTVNDYKTGLLNFNPTGAFPGSGEQGLAGIVVDPTNGDIYADMVHDDGAGNHYPQIVRFQSADGGRTASTMTVIMSMPGETMGQSHQISNLSFGPDGNLYVHIGDGFDATKGQDLTSFRGKILRMTRDGAALPDNPFYNAADGITATDYVYAYGLRNPFGGAWRLSDGSHITVENGPSNDRISKLVRGRNYLYDGSDASMNNYAMLNWLPAHAPVNITFVQATVFGGSGFPATKMDHAFISESGPTYADGPQDLGKRISEIAIDASGTITSGPNTLIQYAGSGKGSVVGLTAGPDGLYFTDLYKDLNYASPIDRGSNVWRVRYAPSRPCCTPDFNGDGDVGTDADIEAFFACMAGDCCATCASADFNNDGDVGTDADIESFFRVLAGGGC